MKIHFTSNFGIARRLTLGFAIIVLVVIISFGVIYRSLNTSEKMSEKNVHVLAPSVAATYELANMLLNSKMLIRSWVFIERQTDTPDKLELKKLHDTDYPKLKKSINSLAQQWPDSTRAKFETTCQAIEDSLFVEHREVMESLSDMESYENDFVVFDVNPRVMEGGEITELTAKLHADVMQIYSDLQSIQTSSNAAMSDSFGKFRLFIIIMIIIVISVAVITSIYTVRSIILPVERLHQSLVEKSEGLFVDEDLKLHNDEIGSMSKALKRMTGTILTSVNRIKLESDLLGRRSEQISQLAENISQGAYQQASSAEEVSASVAEMTESIQQNAFNAKEAENLAQKLDENLNTISDSVNNTAQAMGNISGKIELINEISNKIDMLSINASIEAARAGEAGKGFGVVASEVRKLADHTAQAAQLIGKLASDNVTQADDTKTLIDGIVPEIRKTILMVQEIANASSEQTLGIQQVNSAIQQLADITQESAASAEQLSASSTELLAQADDLMRSVAYFRTSRDE